MSRIASTFARFLSLFAASVILLRFDVARAAQDDGSQEPPEDPFVQKGWRMIDRFYGFRYEIEGDVQGVGFRAAVKSWADEFPCFGWVHNTAKGTVVGEARCNKRSGPKMEERIRKGPPSAAVRAAHIKVYRDTKIRLCFPDFVILPDERITCFEEAPHACEEGFEDDTPDENIIWPEGRWPTDDDFEWDEDLFADVRKMRHEL